jgi:hypothetical protein
MAIGDSLSPGLFEVPTDTVFWTSLATHVDWASPRLQELFERLLVYYFDLDTTRST